MSLIAPSHLPPPSRPLALPEAIPYRPEEDSFDFQRSWTGLRHACFAHRRLIFATCLLTVGLIVFYVKFFPAVYVAQVSLVGESNQDRSRENFYSMWAVFRGGQLTDEAHQITAAPVLAEVINRLQLRPDEVYRSFFGYIGYRWTNSTVGLFYRGWKEWLFPAERGPFAPTEAEVRTAGLLRDLRSGVVLDRVMESNVGKLIVRGPTPRVGQIANTVVQVYMEQRRQRQVQEAEAAYAALNEELDKARDELGTIEARMRQYFTENRMLLTFERDRLEVGQSAALQAAIVELRAGIAANEAALRQVEAELARESRDVVATRVTQANPLRDNLRERLATLQIQRRQALLTYRTDSVEVLDLDRQIGILSSQLGTEPASTVRQTTTVLSSRYEELRGRAATLRAEMASQRANLAAKTEVEVALSAALQLLPEKMRVVAGLNRDHGTVERRVTAIQERMMMAAVSRATAQTAPAPVRVIDPAAAPSEPSWPSTKLLLLGAIAVGLLAGVLLALVMDLFFARVHRFRLANSTSMPVYAVVRRDRSYAHNLFPQYEHDDDTGQRA